MVGEKVLLSNKGTLEGLWILGEMLVCVGWETRGWEILVGASRWVGWGRSWQNWGRGVAQG